MKISQKIKEEIVKDYISGTYIKDICIKYNVNKNYPTYLIKSLGLQLRGSGGRNLNNYNQFKDPSPERDYWIGYIISDGCITYNSTSRSYRLSIYSIDNEIVTKFKKFCNCNIHTKEFGKLMYIDSKELIEYFINTLNIKPRKSRNINPNIEINWNIFRGIFDGDGFIRKDRFEMKITSSSIDLLNRLKEFLDTFNIKNSINLRKGNITYDLYIYGKDNIYKIFTNMYNGELFLKRKYDRFVALLSD